MDALTDVRFWMLVLNDVRCTLVCTPDLESRVKTQIAARGLSGLVTVHATILCPADQILIMRDSAPALHT